MKVNSKIKLSKFIFRNILDLDYSPYYTITNGIIEFQDKATRLYFMKKYGAECGAELRVEDNKYVTYYYGKRINEEQLRFLRQQVQFEAGLRGINVNHITGTKHECGCKKNKKQ